MSSIPVRKTFFLCTAALLSLTSVYGIKISIPKQYEDQVEEIKAAEQAERERQISGLAEGSVESESDLAGGSIEDAPAIEPESKPQSTLAESIAEATAAVNEIEDAPAGKGFVSGQIVDKETGQPIAGVAILFEGTDIGTITGRDGRYTLGPAEAGEYTISFIKTGYIEANVTEFQVVDGEVSVFPFAMPPRPAEMSDEVYVLQDFTVTADEANDLVLKMELRLASTQALDVFGADDFSKFAASDVGEAIKRLPGVNIEEGKFAVIRGLDERYTSTLFNGAPVPSPDPVKQSVPLDLFPSEVVENIVVSKTYASKLPGNSVGGNISIHTNDFPESLEIKGSVSTGFNENAQDRFFSDGDRPRIRTDFDQLGSFSNRQAAESFNDLSRLTPREDDAGIDHEFSLQVGNTLEFLGRDLRFSAVLGAEKDYRGRVGSQEKRSARAGRISIRNSGVRVRSSGDYVLGRLTDTEGSYDYITSSETDRFSSLAGVEFDLNEEGTSKIGYTFFFNKEEEAAARVLENGNLFGFDPDGNGHDLNDIRSNSLATGFFDRLLSRGALDINARLDAYFDSSLYQLNINENIREIEVHQVNGEFSLEKIREDLTVDFLVSRSETLQEEIASIDTAGFRLPDNFLAPGANFITGSDTEQGIRDFVSPSISWRENKEEQDFVSVGVCDKFMLPGGISTDLNLGFSIEETAREVSQEVYILNSNFLEIADATPFPDPEGTQNEIDLITSRSNWPTVSGGADPAARTESEREVTSAFFEYEAEINEMVTIALGARYESINLTTETIPGGSGSDFFNFDLLRRSTTLAPTDPTDTFSPAFANAQLLGLPDALPSDFIGQIEEDYILPAATIVISPIEGLRVIGAFSETIARPSFREFTYLTTQDPTTGDFTTGNPTLTTSEATSLDLRIEYFAPDNDMIAIGIFHKTVENPIEKTILGGSNATSEFFYNNPNDAEVYGVEFEFRSGFPTFGSQILEYFSFGGNFSYIESTIRSLDSIRAVHEEGFQLLDSGGNVIRTIGGGYYADLATGEITGFQVERGLVNQPEWLANFDISFDQPEWGTRATISAFAQSDVLRTTQSFAGGSVPNRYDESFYELNFTLSQRFFDRFVLGFSVKNLTNTERNLVYDESGFSEVAPELSYKTGRSYSLSLSGEF